MNLDCKRVILGALVLSLATSFAIAGPLPTDPAALPGFQGSHNFTGPFTNDGFGDVLDAKVEYAVYAPGAFGASAVLGLPGAFDPSGGTQYVYAYEVFDNATSTVVLQNLSVALIHGGGITSLANITDDPMTPEGGWPTNQDLFVPGTSPEHNAKWLYSGPFPGPGQHSDILLFTSPLPPTMFNAAMQGGFGTIGSATVPTPIPEPSSAALALTALACLGTARWLRRRVA